VAVANRSRASGEAIASEYEIPTVYDNWLELMEADDIDADFYSLQRPVSRDDKGLMEKHGVTDLEPELASYAHTGALIRQMDLIISVDTSVAHLAGALDIPTWILVAARSDWRWLERREDSPWYPAVRLIRQRQPGQWRQVMETVRAGLKS